MNSDLIAIQERMVRLTANCAPRGWIEFIGYAEVDEECESLNGTYVCVEESNFTRIDAMDPDRQIMSYELYDILRELWNANNKNWASVLIRIDKRGRFRLDYDGLYHRLSGEGDLAYNPVTRVVEEIERAYRNHE